MPTSSRRLSMRWNPLVAPIVARGLDARKEDDITAFLREADAHAPLEVCVFNVGGNVNFPAARHHRARLPQGLGTRLLCGFLTGREAARLMLPRGRGCIFFTGATASLRGGIGYAAFASAKHGLRAVAQSMARELGPKNIHVAHLIIDAGVDTAFVRERIKQKGGDAASTICSPTSSWIRRRSPKPIGSSIASRAMPGRSSSIRGPMARCGEMAKVEFHFDFGSPNAYLAHRVIPEIEQRTGVEIRLCADPARRRVQAHQQPLAGREACRHQEPSGIRAARNRSASSAVTASHNSSGIRSSRSTRF